VRESQISRLFSCVSQTACKDADKESASGVETLPLLADLVLYYCRHADQPVLVQLYQAEVRGAHTHTHTHAHSHLILIVFLPPDS